MMTSGMHRRPFEGRHLVWLTLCSFCKMRQGGCCEEESQLQAAVERSVKEGSEDAALYWVGRYLRIVSHPLPVAQLLLQLAVSVVGKTS